jgi:DNA replication protein DnaC
VVIFERADGLVTRPCQCSEQKRIQRMFKRSGLSDDQLAIRLKQFKPNAQTLPMYRIAERYLKEFPEIFTSSDYSKGIALMGTVGIGKTMLMLAITNELLEKRIPVIFITTPDLIAELRVAQFTDGGQEMEDKISQLSTAKVVIFDDLGKEKITEWVQTQYFRIINARYIKKLPTLFTSNYDSDEIAERLGDAISSRLYALTKTRQIFIGADDYRVVG